MKVIYLILLATGLTTSSALRAEEASSAPANSAASGAAHSDSKGGVQEVEKPLNVNGQTRNLSMMLTFSNEKEKIQFFDVRRNYQEEVPKTNY
jgi:hypothetical protein